MESMDDDTICHHLEQLAAHLGVAIRYEPSAGKAGFCLLHGEKVIFVDERLNLRNRAGALARILCRFECDDVFLPPVVRELLETCRGIEAQNGGDAQAFADDEPA